jgi:hypothetical protein
MDIDDRMKSIKTRINTSIVMTCVCLFIYLVVWDSLYMCFTLGVSLGYSLTTCSRGVEFLRLKKEIEKREKKNDKTDKSV